MTSALLNDIKATNRFALARAVSAMAAPNDPERNRIAHRVAAACHQGSYRVAVDQLRGR